MLLFCSSNKVEIKGACNQLYNIKDDDHFYSKDILHIFSNKNWRYPKVEKDDKYWNQEISVLRWLTIKFLVKQLIKSNAIKIMWEMKGEGNKISFRH